MKPRKNNSSKAWLSIFFLLFFIFAGASYVAFPQIKVFLAGLMPLETSKPESLTGLYNMNDFRILIIPGHDNFSRGAEFGGLYETDVNLELAKYLYEILSADKSFKVYTTREFSDGSYNSIFSNYIKSEEANIINFRSESFENMENAIESGQVQLRPGISHNRASDRGSINLYAFNKWANENKINLLVHIHFNDHAGRKAGRVGKYSGFSIYVPDSQYSSARSSKEIAESVFRELEKFFHVSTFPGENRGIIEDQELIAVGSNGSLDGSTMLIEYGYIYESALNNYSTRSAYLKELAHQTYSGIKKYFEPSAPVAKTTLLPFVWNAELGRGSKSARDIFSLQVALSSENVYPPPGKSKSVCPIAGIFGSCTEESVRLFQNKYTNDILSTVGLTNGSGYVGPSTIRKLNQLYGK